MSFSYKILTGRPGSPRSPLVPVSPCAPFLQTRNLKKEYRYNNSHL